MYAVGTVLDCVFVQCFARCLPMLHAIYDRAAFDQRVIASPQKRVTFCVCACKVFGGLTAC